MPYALVPVAVVVFLGACTQRVTGMGFALIASPLLVLLIGPHRGIILVNLLGLMVSSTVLAATWRQIDRRRALLLVPTGMLGVVPGVYVAQRLPASHLQTVIGLLVLAGLAGALATPARPTTSTPLLTTTAGFASGFMTATAGVGGPALTVYALATGWRQALFVATAQISFASQSVVSLGLKNVRDLPGWTACAGLLLAVTGGLVVGQLLTGRVPVRVARRGMIGLALAGALTTVVKGFLS